MVDDHVGISVQIFPDCLFNFVAEINCEPVILEDHRASRMRLVSLILSHIFALASTIRNVFNVKNSSMRDTQNKATISFFILKTINILAIIKEALVNLVAIFSGALRYLNVIVFNLFWFFRFHLKIGFIHFSTKITFDCFHEFVCYKIKYIFIVFLFPRFVISFTELELLPLQNVILHLQSVTS